jgi:hypothetical protein
MANNTDFTLNKDSYASFDALTLKKLIKQRLDDGGVFTDQIFEGSNISAIIDIIAYSYHTLLFYLNQTASESLFSETTLYENMNRIVKLIDYKPNGFQTSLLPFKVTANGNIPQRLFTIKRYSYFTLNGIYYSFKEDATFNKNTNILETLTEFQENNILHQGQYFEYPVQIGIGEDFETVSLVLKDNTNDEEIFIDDNTLDVYVKDANTGKFTYFSETDNIFLNSSDDSVFEKRINENGFYEFKFGNGVFGKKINLNDEIYIYYLKSEGEKGIVSVGQLDGNQINFFTTPQFETINKDIYDETFTFLPSENLSDLNFSNDVNSTNSREKETVDEIRTNSIKLFQSQDRLVTTNDYKFFINKNFSSIVNSSSVVSNQSFVKEFVNYFYNLGLDRPNDDSRFLFNQVKFSSPSQNNNLYLFLVPKINPVLEDNTINFLTTSQKNDIIENMTDNKMANIELIPQDPIYNAFSIGLTDNPDEILTKEIIDSSFLVIKRNIAERVSADSIKQKVNNIFVNYFKDKKIGDTVSISDITNQILNLTGVSNLFTRRINNGKNFDVQGLNLLSFNVIYDEEDIEIISADINLPFFKFPFLYNNNIIDNIVVEEI